MKIEIYSKPGLTVFDTKSYPVDPVNPVKNDNKLAKGWGQTVTPLHIENELVTICNQLKLPSYDYDYFIIKPEIQIIIKKGGQNA